MTSMISWELYQHFHLIEKGLRERLEKASKPAHIIFILSAIMDAREARLRD